MLAVCFPRWHRSQSLAVRFRRVSPGLPPCGLQIGQRVLISWVMCGRYDNVIPRDAYGELFGAARIPLLNFPPRYNIAPTDQIPIVRIDPRDGERELVMARWGLIPFWMKEKPKVPHINARAETVHKLPLFREAFARRRCLIPATGFYEWQQREDGKQPYRFRRKDLEPFALRGVWDFARLAGGGVGGGG